MFIAKRLEFNYTLEDDGGVCPEGAARLERIGVEEEGQGPDGRADDGAESEEGAAGPSDPFIKRGRLVCGAPTPPPGGLRGSACEYGDA
jgi:hypothetical protein